MAKAFKCDICGDCIDEAADAKTRWVVATINGQVSGIDNVNIGVGLSLDSYDHACPACRVSARQAVVQWIKTNL